MPGWQSQTLTQALQHAGSPEEGLEDLEVPDFHCLTGWRQRTGDAGGPLYSIVTQVDPEDDPLLGGETGVALAGHSQQPVWGSRCGVGAGCTGVPCHWSLPSHGQGQLLAPCEQARRQQVW